MNECMKGVALWANGFKETLRWFGHNERKNSKEFVKKVYTSEIVRLRRIRNPVVGWKDMVKKYMHERSADRWEGIEQERRECLYKER